MRPHVPSLSHGVRRLCVWLCTQNDDVVAARHEHLELSAATSPAAAAAAAAPSRS